jgi:hypothetical protein
MGGTHPHQIDEYQNKGDRKWAIRKSLKRKGEIYLGGLEKGVISANRLSDGSEPWRGVLASMPMERVRKR